MNQLKSTLLLALGLTITTQLFSQNFNINQAKSANDAIIEVSGTAEITVAPDEIYIAITLQDKGKGEDKISVEEQERELVAAVTALNIPMENFEIVSNNTYYGRVSWFKKDMLAKGEYNLKVSDTKQLGAVFKKLDELKVNYAHITHASHSKMDSLVQAVKVKAIKAAKKKADYLLNAIGENTGSPILVRETEGAPQLMSGLVHSRNAKFSANYHQTYNDYDVSSTRVGFQKIKISKGVYVMFGIEEKNKLDTTLGQN